MSDEFRLPKVRFRYDLVAFGEQRNRLLELYRVPFGDLMRTMLETRVNAADYADLPRIREILVQHRRLQDIAPVAYKHMVRERFGQLLNAAPIYNVCPRDLQAYLLLTFGLRSSHFEELVKQNRWNDSVEA